jgi:hypothetical protein
MRAEEMLKRKVEFFIAVEPTTDDRDSTIYLLAVVFGFYFLFWPIYKCICIRSLACCSKKEELIDKEQ